MDLHLEEVEMHRLPYHLVKDCNMVFPISFNIPEWNEGKPY